MKILIIENEIYLAQSIAAKLGELGYDCDILGSSKEALRGDYYDVVLLSTNISGQDIYPIIDIYKNSILILMVSYISNDTVSKPLLAGAKDYILKPFMIEELIRKIHHFKEYERLSGLNKTYETYLDHLFTGIDSDIDTDRLELPFIISSSNQRYSDALAFQYAKQHQKTLKFISLSTPKAIDDIITHSGAEILYISDFQLLKKADHKALFEAIESKSCILSSTETIDNPPLVMVNIESENRLFEQGEILPIEDYVKYIIINFQNRYPDTELCKKLGISRKSLWEKRKKYGIIKKK